MDARGLIFVLEAGHRRVKGKVKQTEERVQAESKNMTVVASAGACAAKPGCQWKTAYTWQMDQTCFFHAMYLQRNVVILGH
eukprot:gene7031-biopygen7670